MKNQKPSGLKKPSNVKWDWSFFAVPDVLPEGGYLTKEVKSHGTTKYKRQTYILDRTDSYFSDGRIVVAGVMRPLVIK